ncbi:hypothetical protein [Methylobacterium gregans]|uniref:Uncharacterized protein n=1 Tax=Methylobacterium gregans TaxID=374424 RepID=A0AA37HLS6_9HYPH|nr:hypothetical protein [Methylobacterium gregans]MDQ0522186.1 hypothetical protein [Methylobacterium gregans]GJD77811.1 hypothetical protein NBEOAGPD_1022 [Methylobacterium gregans]GLS57135.1 hypothetical protein GCM10007886_53210 [Methylobacterium gregans]
MARIAILVGTPAGTRLLAASSERDAAGMVEHLLIGLDRSALPAPLWVQCADAALAARLTAYLAGFQAELTAAPAGGAVRGFQ